MPSILKLILFIVVICQFANCGELNTGNNCQLDIKYPASQYKYPSSPLPADTGFIYAGYKDSLDKRDSFIYAFYGYHFLKSFKEENLSVTPTGNTILRISYEPSFSHAFVVKMTCNQIILKYADSGYIIPPEDLSKLSEREKLHYIFLSKRYPVNLEKLTPAKRAFVDSLLKDTPELLSPTYYRFLSEKVLVPDSLPLQVSVYTKAITKEKFEEYINRLNNVQFWSLPSRMQLVPLPTDGDGYVVELHTPDKFRMLTSSNCPEISRELTKLCQEIIDEIAPKNKRLKLCY